MLLYRQFYYLFFFAGFMYACNFNKKKLHSSGNSRYDLLNPVTIKLPVTLAEISGIVYYPKDTAVFSIEDEDGILYKIPLNNGKIKNWRFDKKHDFEDLVLLDSVFYVLISNGDIETIQFGKSDNIVTNKFKFSGGDKKVNEFESLYYDTNLQQLILLCKNCEDDSKKTVSAWGYNINTQIYTQSVLTIDVEAVTQKLGEQKMKLKPSATALNPVTNELYILSSINHLLIVAGKDGKIKEVFQLDPGIYKQSEGLAFTPAGDMIISNESHETGLANLLIIKNKKKGL